MNAARTKPIIGRLAPSPTGYLHLGNAWAFLAAWLGVRAAGGRLILRLEDIDPQRSKPEFALALQEDLRWLGLDWDEGPYTQSARFECYAAALESLGGQGAESDQAEKYASGGRDLLYPCFCSRKELRELAGAPQAGGGSRQSGSSFRQSGSGFRQAGGGSNQSEDGNIRAGAGNAADGSYPGVCRNLSPQEREERQRSGLPFAWRINFAQNLRPEFLEFEDLILGRVNFRPEAAGGDFALRRSDGVFAYQLAVVLDDIEQGVTQVVRGEDILGSTPRQLFLQSLFGGERPEYAHLPLLLDHQGERLAKRHASISLRGLRAAGVSPEAIIGWLAHWSGLRTELSPCRARDLVDSFSFSAIKRECELLPIDIADRLLRLRAD
ncbi:MAG: tRNA glutamyl-Q(34) synthetase GluQRS [Deltaproteobacteria bacterium]|nr:tRNA glutamyl-Q(34) synthetase GluQRS [Deltaproteobacteria bacterium]